MTAILSSMRRHRATLLLLALIVELLVSPFTTNHPEAGVPLSLTVLVLLIALLKHIGTSRSSYVYLALVTIVWFAARLLEAFALSPVLSARIASIAGFVLSVSILILMLKRFFRAATTTLETLSEAFMTYLLIAVSYSQLYEIVDSLTSHAFDQVIPPPRGSTLTVFSMLTLSGLGAGDLAAVNPYLRVAVALEPMIGLFYVAVVVSRLVTFYSKVEGRQEIRHGKS